MSDRKPPNPDYLTERSRKAVTPVELQERLAFFDELGVDWQYRNVPEFMFDFVAAARDPVAVVRRGVESGEIEGGRMRAWCKTHEAEGMGYCWRGAFLESADKRFCEMIQAVVIPVSQEVRR